MASKPQPAKLVKVLALKSFPYSQNGVAILYAKEGDEPEVQEAAVEGLVGEGLIAADKKAAAPSGGAAKTGTPAAGTRPEF